MKKTIMSLMVMVITMVSNVSAVDMTLYNNDHIVMDITDTSIITEFTNRPNDAIRVVVNDMFADIPGNEIETAINRTLKFRIKMRILEGGISTQQFYKDLLPVDQRQVVDAVIDVINEYSDK